MCRFEQLFEFRVRKAVCSRSSKGGGFFAATWSPKIPVVIIIVLRCFPFLFFLLLVLPHPTVLRMLYAQQHGPQQCHKHHEG